MTKKKINKQVITFQDQLRLLSGLGTTARSARAGSCHDLTALKSTDAKYYYNVLSLHCSITTALRHERVSLHQQCQDFHQDRSASP